MNHPSEPATPRPLDELRHEGAALLGSGPLAIVGGCGHVGLPLGLAFARQGYAVDLVDTQAERIALVNRGRMPFHEDEDRKSTRLNSSHLVISYAVFCLKKKKRSTT